nr:migration and invasion enhancer 1-like [Penaeus vannamei]
MRVRPRYEELARVIRSKVPQAEVVGAVGRRSAFEVAIDGKLIFSKLSRGKFPDFEEVAEAVKNVESGGEIQTVEKCQASLCTII